MAKDDVCADGSCEVPMEVPALDPNYVTRELENDIDNAVRARIDEIVRKRNVSRRVAAVLFARWLSGCRLE